MKRKENENPILEYLKLLKKNGMLDDKAMFEAIDALSEPDNESLLKEYFDEQSVAMADIALNGKPFPLPDETTDGPIRFGISDNGNFIGFYPHECHFLIAGQTGTGKSTLLKIIFAQALIFNEIQKREQDNGKNNLLALR